MWPRRKPYNKDRFKSASGENLSGCTFLIISPYDMLFFCRVCLVYLYAEYIESTGGLLNAARLNIHIVILNGFKADSTK